MHVSSLDKMVISHDANSPRNFANVTPQSGNRRNDLEHYQNKKFYLPYIWIVHLQGISNPHFSLLISFIE